MHRSVAWPLEFDSWIESNKMSSIHAVSLESKHSFKDVVVSNGPLAWNFIYRTS